MNTKKPKHIMFAIMVVLLMNTNLKAQNELKSTELNVFKNGTYFIVKEGTVNLLKSKTKLELPPNPLLSTYWLTTTKDIGITKVVYMYDTIKKGKAVRSIPDLLRVNIGQRVTITTKLDDKNYIDIVGWLMDYYPQNYIAKLKLDNNSITFISVTDIKKLTFEKPPKETTITDSVALLANIEFNKAVESTRLKLVYMQAGIQWIPSYNVKILSETELQLEMRALVENFAEKIEDANLTLTVGDPQFKYWRNAEPFVSGYLTNLYGTQTQTVTRYAYQNVSPDPVNFPDEAISLVENYNDYSTYTTEGEKTNDLYMYNLGKVNMPKNSKTSFQIFSQKIPYKDVYTSTIGDVVSYATNSYINIDPEKRYDVYHSIKLSNLTKNPFTTAPVFVQNENLQPLAQDELKYTPAGSFVSIQLSKAVDVIIKNNEEEIKKVERAKTLGKNSYNKIIIKGTIDISNLQDKKIVLNLNKGINAEIIEISDSGNIKKPGRYAGLNPYTEASWEIPLNGGEKKTVTYQYEVYVLFR